VSRVAFSGGHILTMDDRNMRADVLVVDGERIVALGEPELLRSYPDVDVVDLQGRTVGPGFIDAHSHLSIAALHPCWADVSDVADIDDLGRRLTEHAAREPDTDWIRAAGWNELTTSVFPRRRDLDALDLDCPVVVAHYSLHQCVVSSRALDVLGIDRRTPDPVGGVIGRDASGEPDGLLVERAWSEAHARSMSAYEDPDRWGEHIVAYAHRLIADGITAVHDAACSPAAERCYALLAKAGRLPIGVLAMPHPALILNAPTPDRLEGAITGEGDERFRIGAVKLFADGGVAPAVDAHHRGQPVKFGTVFPDLTTHVSAAAERGFQVAVHALGNVGLAGALEAFTHAARRDPDGDHRFRVEHACLADARQAATMAALGAVGVVQPGFLHHLGQAVEGFGFDDATWLPFGTLARAGVPLAASSDDPCTFYEPLRTSAHGATRRTGSGNVLNSGESVTYDDWLRAYTAGAAYAGRQDGERGRIAPGLRADFVVLDGPLDPENPPRVAETWIGGRRVFPKHES